jgi:uncharacterized protein
MGADPPSDTDRQEVRLAALLHDCGHGVFSHASETLVKENSDIRGLVREKGIEGSAPYEAFSFLLTASAAFGAFLQRMKDKHPRIAGVDAGRLAEMIVGRASPDRQYLAGIISGPFDADKLDYIARDSRASGLDVVVDLPRLLYAMQARWIKPEGTHWVVAEDGAPHAFRTLLVRWTAASVLEQILFAKIQLFMVVYHHGKVRAAEALAREALSLSLRDGVIRPIDLLRLADDEVIRGGLQNAGSEARDAFERLARRRLPRRAAVLATSTYLDQRNVIQRTLASSAKFEIQRQLAAEIRDRAGFQHELDVLFDLPPLPPLNEAARSAVISHDDQTVVSLNQTFPTEDWLQAYAVKKWRGHVFGPSERSLQPKAFQAAADVLGDRGVQLDELAATLAHVAL